MNLKNYLLSASVSLIIISQCKTASVKAQYELQEKPRFTFAVISDIHTNTIKFTNALQDLHNNVDSDLSALVLNGDITNQGLQKDYDAIKNTLIGNWQNVPKNVIRVMGNHEYYDFIKGPNSNADMEMFKNRFLQNNGLSCVYFDRWIKGYHFIVLSSEKTYPKRHDSIQARLSQNQLVWLKTKISEKYHKGKPVFIFLHQPLSNTVTATDYFTRCIEQDSKLRIILAEYPEVMFFTSHTHRILTMPKAFVHNKFYMINTSSVNNPQESNPDGSDKNINSSASEGLYVQVFKDKVVIKGREFSQKAFLPGAEWTAGFKNK